MIKRAMTSLAGFTLLATLGLACSSDDEGTDTTEEVDETDAPDGSEAPADTTAGADTTAAPDAPAGGTEFTIEGFEFQEGFVATAGEAFTVVNADGPTHTLTSAEFGVTVSGGGEESLTIDAAGEYAIFCEIHPNMTGTIRAE